MRLLPVAALLLAIELPAQAPDSARVDSVTRVRAVTITESRAAGTVGGASAVIVKVDELRSSPAPLLEEALRESPFVHVRQNSRGEMELSIRGSDSRQAAVLMDGVPLTLGWDHRTDPGLIPVAGAQSLVIVRGLSSLLHGPNTLGGTIEVSHDDAFGRLGTGRLWGGLGVDENAAWVASVGGGRELAGIGNGSLSLRAGVAQREREGFTLPGRAVDTTAVDGLRTNSDLREADGFLAARWRSVRGRSVGLMVTGFSAERGVPPEEHLAVPRLWRYPEHTRGVVALSANAGTFRTPLGFATIEGGAGLNTGRLRIQTFGDRSYSVVTATELGRERTWTSRAVLSHSLPRDARLRAAITFANVDYAETLPGDSALDYRQQLLSGGAEIDLPLSTRTALSGGLVHDESATPLSGGRAPRQDAMSSTGWRAGITHDRDPGMRIHASASRRSRFPALRELYSGALDRFLPNPDLEPESLLGFEAGFTMDRSLWGLPDVRLQLTAFHHDLVDAIARTALPAPDQRFFRLNRDRILSTGAELMAGIAVGPREQSVSLTADAMLQDVRILDPTATAAGVRHAENNPESRGMLEISLPLRGNTRGFLNTRYTGVQYCLNADSGTEMQLAESTEFNGAVEHRIRVASRGPVRSVRALMALDNAGNTTIYDQCGLPQAGRTLRMMLSFQ